MDEPERIVVSNQGRVWHMLSAAAASALALFLALAFGRGDHVQLAAAEEVTPSLSLGPETGAPAGGGFGERIQDGTHEE